MLSPDQVSAIFERLEEIGEKTIDDPIERAAVIAIMPGLLDMLMTLHKQCCGDVEKTQCYAIEVLTDIVEKLRDHDL